MQCCAITTYRMRVEAEQNGEYNGETHEEWSDCVLHQLQLRFLQHLNPSPQVKVNEPHGFPVGDQMGELSLQMELENAIEEMDSLDNLEHSLTSGEFVQY